MRNKLLVLSMDAMVWEDVALLQTLPNFGKLFGKMSGVKKMRTIYPSITYPAHVSIMTGARPGRTGVFTNGKLHTGAGVHWHYDGRIVRCGDIFEAAKKAGAETAAVFWPVTGHNPNIDHLINEYFFPEPGESPEEGFARWGADAAALQAVRENLDRWPVNYRNREGVLRFDNTYDHFLIGCSASLIRNTKPDVLFIHNCWLDTERHRNGVFNEAVTRGLHLTDEWLGELIRAMEDAGTRQDTDFVLLSDHGQMDFERRIRINTLLGRGGFLETDAEGRITSWKAMAQSNGMSCTVFVRDESVKPSLFSWLETLRQEGCWGIGEILLPEETREVYGLYGDFACIVETDGKTAFADAATEPPVAPADYSDYRTGQATHGYRPEKGPQPVFLCSGPRFKENVLLESGRVIDEAPTLAALWKETLPQAEGIPLRELLKEE